MKTREKERIRRRKQGTQEKEVSNKTLQSQEKSREGLEKSSQEK